MLCFLYHVRKRLGSAEEDVLGDVVDAGADGAQGHAREDVRVVALTGLKHFAVHLKNLDLDFIDLTL